MGRSGQAGGIGRRSLGRTGAGLAAAALLALAGCGGSEQATSSGGGAGGGAARLPGPAPLSAPQADSATPGSAGDGRAAPGSGYGEADQRPVPVPPETSTDTDPVSTIALDVDTASYGYARRQLNDGQWPAAQTVRPEEFINALRQDYPEPDGDGFSVSVDGSRSPVRAGGTADHVLRVGLRTRGRDSAHRPDAALTFVVDVSGSMAEPGRLDLVKDALHTLVGQLRPSDSVAVVAFSDTARTVQPMTPVREKEDLHRAVENLRVERSTNLEAGLVLGYQVARDGFRSGASNRVVLLSDALANVGNTTADPILAQVREQAGKGIALLGVGVGSDYGDALMERLADSGDGFTVYVSDVEQARKVFVEQLPATIEVRALDAKAQVRFDPRIVASYRLVGYEDRAVRDRDFKDDTVDGGEVGPGHTVTALYDVSLREGAEGPLGTVEVHWVSPGSGEPADVSRQITLSDVERSTEDASPWLQADVAAARLAEALRTGTRQNLDTIAADVQQAARELEDPSVTDLAATARRAASLR
jgi:Ca-activated chloride channel homolog